MKSDTIIIDESMARKIVNAFETGDMSNIKEFADHYIIDSLEDFSKALDSKQFNRLQMFSFSDKMSAEDILEIRKIMEGVKNEH